MFIYVRSDPGRLHGKHAKENQTLFTFLTAENLSGQICTQHKYGEYSDLSSYAVIYPGKCIYTVI